MTLFSKRIPDQLEMATRVDLELCTLAMRSDDRSGCSRCVALDLCDIGERVQDVIESATAVVEELSQGTARIQVISPQMPTSPVEDI